MNVHLHYKACLAVYHKVQFWDQNCLFILYINDICNASSILKFILFADDTNVFYSGVDIQTLCEFYKS